MLKVSVVHTIAFMSLPRWLQDRTAGSAFCGSDRVSAASHIRCFGDRWLLHAAAGHMYVCCLTIGNLL